jgi:hypothetical protein
MRNNKIIIFVLAYVILGTIFIPVKNIFPTSKFTLLSTYTNQQYLFNPINYVKSPQHGITVYPHVSTSPQSPLYFLTLLRERQSLLTKNYDPFFKKNC